MMNFKKIAIAAVASCFMVGSAWADGSFKDAPLPSNWTGFYVGGHAGLINGNTQGGIEQFGPIVAAVTATDYDMNGGMYGVHAGYNYQMGSMVMGIEGTYSGSSAQGNSSCVIGLMDCQRKLDWVATVVGRLGYAMDKTMVYGLAGVAWGKLETDVELFGVIPLFEGNETHVGWTVGLGVEHAVSDNMLVRVEYSHIDLGSETHSLNFPGASVPGLPNEVEATFDTIKIGLSYKF
jgi:outer membrane immunogenic protein